MRRKIAFIAIIAFLLFSAWLVAIAAAVLALSVHYDPLTAALTVAGLLVATAVVLIAVMMVLDRIAHRRVLARRARTSLYASAAAFTLPTIIRNRPLLLVALVAGGGVLAANLFGGRGRDGEGDLDEDELDEDDLDD